jgi:peptidyl-prolyl cis-trans isomerase D
MISWIQKTFFENFRIIFLIILGALVVAFVMTIGNFGGGIGKADTRIRSYTLFGTPFSTDEERRAVMTDGQISSSLTSPYVDPNQIQLHAFQRLAALQRANELGIPGPTGEQLEAFIRSLPAFADQDGNYDPQAYARFLDSAQTMPGTNSARFARVLREDWRIQQVSDALSGPGFVLDAIVQNTVAQVDTRWTVQTATIDLSTVQPESEPTEEQLKEWFEANGFRYQTPERMRVGFIGFRAADFLESIPAPTDEQIVRYFEQNKARYKLPPPPTAEGETPAPAATPTLGDVRPQVVADLKQVLASREAANKAASFAYDLFDKKIQPGTPAFADLLAKNNLTLSPIPPFTATQPPPGSGWNPQVLEEAFTLGPSHRISDPVSIGPNSGLLIFEENLAPADALFLNVRDQVLADFQADQRQKQITDKGAELRQSLSDAVASGTPFVEAAEALGLATKTWEDFSYRQPPENIDYGVFTRLSDLPAKSVSSMTVRGDEGVFTYIAMKEVPEVPAGGPEFEKARQRMMTQIAATTLRGILVESVQDELKAAGLAAETE